MNVDNHFDDRALPFFSTAGDTDFNFSEMHRLDEFLAEQGNPHRLVIFEGPHTWMPPEVAHEAVAWMELIAMQRGNRDRDPKMIEELYAADLEGERALAVEGQALVAARRLREMEHTYQDLHDSSEAKESAAHPDRGR